MNTVHYAHEIDAGKRRRGSDAETDVVRDGRLMGCIEPLDRFETGGSVSKTLVEGRQ